jgi:hypothetical protein
MAQEIIGIGAAPDDGTGDQLRSAFDKCNDNFTELYAAAGGIPTVDNDTTLASDSTTNPPSVHAVVAYIAARIAALVNSAPGALDTLKELADALGDDANFAATVTTALAGKLPLTGGTLTGDLVVPAEVYGAGWNGSNEVPTKNDVYDKIEAVVGAVPGAYTDEQAQDAVAAMITQSGLLTASYNDAGNVETLDVPAASASDINAGTSTAKAVTPDALAGSNFGKEVVTILVTDPAGSALTTGDGKAYYPVPSTLNGMNLVSVGAYLTTASSSGIPTVQIANVTDSVDMLSTKLTIDASETSSATAATAAVIDTAHDDVATGDMLRIDVDVAGTGAKGLIVEMQFQLP